MGKGVRLCKGYWVRINLGGMCGVTGMAVCGLLFGSGVGRM